MGSPTKADKIKATVLVFTILAVYYGILLYLLIRLNKWLLPFSLLGITFMGVDIKVIFIGFVFAIFGIWLLLELVDYLQFKAWRRSWK